MLTRSSTLQFWSYSEKWPKQKLECQQGFDRFNKIVYAAPPGNGSPENGGSPNRKKMRNSDLALAYPLHHNPAIDSQKRLQLRKFQLSSEILLSRSDGSWPQGRSWQKQVPNAWQTRATDGRNIYVYGICKWTIYILCIYFLCIKIYIYTYCTVSYYCKQFQKTCQWSGHATKSNFAEAWNPAWRPFQCSVSAFGKMAGHVPAFFLAISTQL